MELIRVDYSEGRGYIALQSLARNGYASSQVDKALHSSVRELHFKYYLLDYLNQFKVELLTATKALPTALDWAPGPSKFVCRRI
ncbi:hypothetical protein [Desulfosporosinus sp. Sb-LF]|uniref:hypothetical protein n=1 Tax=Desulfosporosinus sp. Sb-LF TaxID=2560027 RepID=UPI00107F2067|nr:hypothetical protein [Desulfosporosinus sp. Sb-LF]TGE32984.1 hypothetical protein E4K68_09065 [Desulfosporosinus sp. Sb-LF]